MTSDTSSTVLLGAASDPPAGRPHVHPDPTAASDEGPNHRVAILQRLKEPIPRAGLRRFTPAPGRLWVCRLTTVSVPPDGAQAPGI